MSPYGRARYAPDALPRPAHWSRDAACLEAAPDLFHPEGDAGVVLMVIAEAKRWCARCVVREQCLADAMARGEAHGVWGGLDAKERRAIARRERGRTGGARRRVKREEAAGVTSTAAEPADANSPTAPAA